MYIGQVSKSNKEISGKDDTAVGDGCAEGDVFESHFPVNSSSMIRAQAPQIKCLEFQSYCVAIYNANNCHVVLNHNSHRHRRVTKAAEEADVHVNGHANACICLVSKGIPYSALVSAINNSSLFLDLRNIPLRTVQIGTYRLDNNNACLYIKLIGSIFDPFNPTVIQMDDIWSFIPIPPRV
ncbi:50S ribosomal protein [Dirofilaria immitis]